MFVRQNNLRNWNSSNSQDCLENKIKKRIKYLKTASHIIQNIYANKPAGLVHAQILSKVIKRPIRLWQNERVVFTCGKTHGSIPAIEAEYRKLKNGVGHWSLRGGKDATATSRNSCLYEVVASQTGFNSLELKRKATVVIRQQSYIVAKALLASDESLLLGGARYTGSKSEDAKVILDTSQNGKSHPEGTPGHPRGHADYPPTCKVNESVQTYSSLRRKTGFLSRDDQDYVCHHTLITKSARDLMERLNTGINCVNTNVGSYELERANLPEVQRWYLGKKQDSPGRIRSLCLVGKHFLKHHEEARANLFVLTFYPIM